MAQITGQEAIIRDGKIIGAPIVSAQANKVLVTDGNGAIIGSDVSRQRLSVNWAGSNVTASSKAFIYLAY